MEPIRFIPCQIKSGEFQPGVDEVLDIIDTNPQPSEFDNKIQAIAQYRLGHGGFFGKNALARAAEKGNVPLVRHLLSRDPSLVNMGNSPGWTPLMFASSIRSNPQAAVQVAKALIKAGANVNMTSTDAQQDDDDGRVWMDNTSPLEIALDRGNAPLVKLLIKNNAITNIPVSEEGKKMIQQAVEELKLEDKRKILFQAGARKNPLSVLRVLPAELRKMIFHLIKED